MEQLVQVNNGGIVIAENLLKRFHDFQVLKAQMEIEEKEIKESLLGAMEQNGIKGFENEFVKITYKAPSVRKAVDTAALKEQGLYDSFIKETPVKASVQITWK